ncbi:SusC/RagA family TonB-linked outer membrane protein [Mucilaginibacter sp. Bleaf8]|uniref:SusC/RagA family TonB-linked outer membrane protein n=1 Tax=Mucilaginibacter sp. Bleaf8 TaxID=2834430 RepID=UPI001BD1320A|nr:SusC/RagA family TonB-linked outer membrane protein [Mucilaginibacter sp. Bleaf8]MBS7565540.1 SusC/RagA family TonB-linked outer membrane protein [Mucilaginibacter sp. Bleaf8]
MKLTYIIFCFLLLHLSQLCFSQTITGTVVNTRNEPLDGITIAVKGGKTVGVTDEKGYFKLRINDASTVLRFTAAFAEPLEITVGPQQTLRVVLQTKTTGLDEVHVIAYGTTSQRNTVGTISKISAAELSQQVVTNPLAALQGRVPGMVVTSTSGLPGASFNVQIRGQNTLNPNRTASPFAPSDNPLFIVDGVPYAAQNTNINQFSSLAAPGNGNIYNNHSGGLSPFNNLNPSDIESIEVLRDADATAIYGSRGGNGVILITTKKGKMGKTELGLNLSEGLSFVGSTMPMLNTAQYLAMRKEAFANNGLIPSSDPSDQAFAPDLTVFDATRNTNWKKEFLGNTASSLNLNTALSGGTASTQFRLGAGVNRDTYIFPGDFADERITFSTGLHHTSEDKRLNVDFSALYGYDRNNSASNPSILSAYTLEPNYPSPLDSRGNLVWNYQNVPLDGSYAAYNPYAYLKQPYSVQNTSLNANLVTSYRIITGLVFRTSLGYSTFGSDEYSGTPAGAQNPGYNPVASALFGKNNFATWIAEPQLDYKRSFGKLVSDLLVGSTFQKQTNTGTQVQGTGYINDDLIHSISGAPTQTASDTYLAYKYTSLFGRLNLRWNNRYIIDAAIRRDGSSRFGPNREFGTFGSAGGAWVFSEENLFKKSLSFLSYGKLRATYGTTGNDQIANYQFLSRWAPTPYSYQGSIGYAPQNLYNPDFGWATTQKLDIGLDLGFLRDRLLFSANWFRNRSGHQLITYQLPNQTGFSNVLENWDAVVQNTGWEFTLQLSPVKTTRFSWSTSFNITFPQNKLLSFPGLAQSSYATTYLIGQPLSVQNKFRSAGVDPASGLFQFYDAAGQVTQSPVEASSAKLNDFYNVGNLDPVFYGGWQHSFTYRNFRLDILMEFRKQKGINYLAQVYSFLPGTEMNIPAALLNHWRTAGDVVPFQRLSSQYGEEATSATYFAESDATISDASYLRFKTVSLSYAFPAPILRKISVKGLRLFASAQNLFTLTRYKGNDPETQSFYGIPTLKNVTCGLQFTF